ncbi:MAG: molecular chaperone DnaJ [Chloroflexota bacterium]
MTTQRDYYDILGLERGATDADLKKAFRKLAQQWHPDVSRDDNADERFKEINEAYQVLSDPQRRQAYDMFGRAGAGGAGFDPGAQAGFGAFSDLFDAFFGGSTAGGGGVRRGRPAVGSDLRYDLRISFEESMRGTEREIEFGVLDRCTACAGSGAKSGTATQACPQCAGRGEIRHTRQTMLGQMVNVVACPRCRGEGKVVESPCEDCGGDGRKERSKRLRVAVPAGIDDGHQIRLSSEGEAGPRGGPPGSLYVAIHVAAHPRLRREGTELYHELDLSIAQAALGTTVRVPTADGEEDLEIKPGTQPGTEIRLRGRGAPHLRRAGARGDLHVLVDVTIPTRLSKEQREALEAYAAASGETNVGTGKGGVFERIKDALG